MSEPGLFITVMSVFGGSVVLLAFAFAARRAARRHVALMERHGPRCRREVEELVFTGAAPRPVTAAQRRLTRDMLLHHLEVLRGPEADAVVRHLEEGGYIGELVEQLRHGPARRRALAADLLGRTRSPKAVAALFAALTDEREDVRVLAARSLAQIGDEAAVEALAAALTTPTRWALAMVADDLIVLGRAAVPSLLKIVAGADARAAAAAVRVLGEIGDPAAVRPLTDLLRCSDDVDCRAQAATALGKIDGGRAVEALRRALHDPAWEVRAQAAKALGRLADHTSARALERAMPDPNWWVRVNCGDALARLGDPGMAALRRLTESKDRYAADQAWAALTIGRRLQLEQRRGTVGPHHERRPSRDTATPIPRPAGTRRPHTALR